MATLNQTRNAIDTFISNNWATIVARQENFRTNRGHYWQGVRTHTVTPTHTNSTDGSSEPDRLDDSPSDDLFAKWSAAFPEWAGTKLGACLKVDTYDGPLGVGWALTIEVIHNGNLYRRCLNVGPETNRAYGWQLITPPA